MEFRKAASCGKTIRARKFASPESLAEALAAELANHLAAPTACAVMLAGGTTPLAAYRIVATRKPAIHPGAEAFFSDDRHVPPDDPRSNGGLITPILRDGGLADVRVLRVHGEEPLAQATARYDAELRALFTRLPCPFGILGLGADGHTASLFTPDDLTRAADAFSVSVTRPDGMNGVSMTPSSLARVARIVVVVQGAAKREIASAFLTRTLTTTAGLALQGHRGVELWSDADAWPLG